MNAHSKWSTTFLNLQGTKSYPSTSFTFSTSLLSHISRISPEHQQTLNKANPHEANDGRKNGENERCFRKLSYLEKRKNELALQETLLE